MSCMSTYIIVEVKMCSLVKPVSIFIMTHNSLLLMRANIGKNRIVMIPLLMNILFILHAIILKLIRRF